MKKTGLLFAIISLLASFKPKPLTWVALGDSITYLNEHVDETGNRITKGFMTRVAEKLTNVSYINQGHNGWTSGEIAKEIETLGLTKADIYTVFLGTNDWWHSHALGSLDDYNNNKGIETVYGSFRIIIDKIRSLNPQAKIILLTPMQRADFIYLAGFKNNAHGSYKEKDGQSLEQFAEAMKTIAAHEHISVIDLYHTAALDQKKLVKFKRLRDPKTGDYKNYPYPDYTQIPFNPETDEYPYPPEATAMTYDGLHPSDKGYEVIAKKLIKEIKKY